MENFAFEVGQYIPALSVNPFEARCAGKIYGLQMPQELMYKLTIRPCAPADSLTYLNNATGIDTACKQFLQLTIL
jgi:hypothetical protein